MHTAKIIDFAAYKAARSKPQEQPRFWVVPTIADIIRLDAERERRDRERRWNMIRQE